MSTPSSIVVCEPPVLAEAPRRVNAPLDQIASEPQQYRHVPFQAMGAARVLLGPIQPLPVRRFILEDDEA